MINTIGTNFSKHSLKRINMRRIDQKCIDLCLNYGKKIYRTGIVFYVLLKRTIEKLQLPKELEGLCVLVAHDNTIITVYKNREAASEVKKLNKYNLKKNKKKFLDYIK
jgi:hypothetical protein